MLDLSGYSSDDELSSPSIYKTIRHHQKHRVKRKTFQKNKDFNDFSQGSSKENFIYSYSDIMSKYSELKNSSKYGSVQSVFGHLHRNSSIFNELHNHNTLNDLSRPSSRKVYFHDMKRVEPSRSQPKKKEPISERLKRAVEKIQNLAVEKRDDILREDSDEMIHIRLDSDPEEERKIPREVWKTVIEHFIIPQNFSILLF